MARKALFVPGLFVISLLLGQWGLTRSVVAQGETLAPVQCPTATPTPTPTFTVTPIPSLTPTPTGVATLIGDVVWEDWNQNGRQDSGEPGSAGIIVQLWDSGTTLLAHTQTDASGRYALTAYAPGQFRVRVLLPGGGDVFAPQDVVDEDAATDDEALDSDIIATGSEQGFSDIILLTGDSLIDVRQTADLDAGIIRCGVRVSSGEGTPATGNPASATAPAPTDVPVASLTVTGTALPSLTATFTQTPLVATSTDMPADVPTATPTDVPSNTPSATPSPSPTGTQTPSPTAGPGLTLIPVTLVQLGTLSFDFPTPTRTPTPINMGNFVWDDLDQDGRQDAGEPGLAGVTVQLWNSAKSQLLGSTVTNASGIYTLIAPLPGNYRVRIVLPDAGDQFSPMNQAGGDDTDDSDFNPSGGDIGFTDVISIASNVISITSIDGGIILFRTPTPTRTPTPINMGNFVWDDLDQDGRQDAGEPGLAGVTVQLWNSAKSQLLGSAVTNASGIYTLIAPLPGNYRVRIVLPDAGDQFSPMNQAGGDDTDDSDFNPSGSDIGFTDVISIASNVISITSIDGGIIRFRTPTPTRTPTPINLGNFVWDDLDQDGRQDAGEPGLAGVTVQLWNSAKTQLLGSAVTNASGIYTLIAPLPGNYRVRIVLPDAGDQFSPMNQAGGDDTDDSDFNPSGSDIGFTDVISIASNVISITSIDGGIIRFRTPTPTRTPTPINLGNFVWDDLDQDGRHDLGEPGLAGVTVQLWNSAMTQLLAVTVTSDSGNYTVVAPLPGNYRVRVVLPDAGDEFSPKDVGADDSVDSDINPSGAALGFTDVISIASNVISITNIDVGIITESPLLIAPAIPLTLSAPVLQPLSGNVCAGFRLSSPLDGLPNGFVTFYWDPAAVPMSYQVQVLEGGRVLATFDGGTGTNASGDVSSGAIGGAFSFTVRVVGFLNGSQVCTSEANLLRESGGGPPPVIVPTPTPTRCPVTRQC
ncbi:MAG: hypothetical protein KME04_17370 [Pleurocapsa minor GSE-CHR-MK-17-07R]|jgi:protocatechuate 3,4-dioxygenase beta subunit|nr:hypothetical protein [Pleurocapsa minor GSE-CHR-MK 17-07R]